jgi:hypothetical protein
MRRALMLALGLLIAMSATTAGAGQAETYERSLEITWDAAVKAIRDMDYVLVDSDRSEHTFEMRTKSQLSAKRGHHMQVTLLSSGPTTTTVQIDAVNPKKAERVAPHIRRYFEALDERLD